MKCRFCNETISYEFLNLENQPLSNGYLTLELLARPEITFPLKLLICENCLLVQTKDYASAEDIFSANYAYFSSTSQSWLAHARDYTDNIVNRLNLNKDSMVVEIASNDGYLLRNFISLGIPCIGIEPSESTANAAIRRGIPTIKRFFSYEFSREFVGNHGKSDLVIGNNVFAHVPDINNFTRGIASVLKKDGVVTLEFPYLLKMIELNQFDTAYHEHFSYFSFSVVKKIFERAGLRIFDVDNLNTHGGSLRIYGCLNKARYNEKDTVKLLLKKELETGMSKLTFYQSFQRNAVYVKNSLLHFLLKAHEQGKTIAGYGAAAKGNTMLNFAGIKKDLLPVVYDASPFKQGKFLPGSHIPIEDPNKLKDQNVDYILILPWNIANEIQKQLSYLSERGTKFIVAVPNLRIL